LDLTWKQSLLIDCIFIFLFNFKDLRRSYK
jgi:hypothetical protein